MIDVIADRNAASNIEAVLDKRLPPSEEP